MKFHNKMKIMAIIFTLAMFLVACGKKELISTKHYDIHTKLAEMESATAPLTKQLTEDVFLTQTDMNGLSYEIYTMWQELLDEIIDVLKENLSKKEYKAFQQEQADWEMKREEAVKNYVSEFGNGSIVPLFSNMKMTEQTKLRAIGLAKYFTRP